MSRSLVSRRRWKGILSKAAVCTKALVCEEAWKTHAEKVCCLVWLEHRGLVCGGGGVAGCEDRHKQRISSSNPCSITAGCALDREENEQKNRHFSSNHVLVVLTAFVLRTYF